MSDATRSPNRKGEGARLRDELLDAALRLVDEEGFGALSLRAIARGAGISAPSVYLHFSNLDALVAAVVGQCFDELITEITTERDAQQDPDGRLLASCRGYLHYAHSHPGRYALLFGRVPGPDGQGGTLGHHHDGSQQAFAVLVAAVTASLDSRNGTTSRAQQVATAVWVGLDGFANLRTQRPNFPWPDTETMLQALVLDHIPAAPPPT